MSADTGIKAVAFDVDGTLITHTIWSQLHALFGVSAEMDDRLFAPYSAGKESFAEWTAALVREYRKRPCRREEVEGLGNTFDFEQGAEKVVAALKARYPMALISSGLDIYVRPVARALGIERAYAFSTVEFDERGCFADIRLAREESEGAAKVTDLKDFCASVGVRPDEVVFVGDSKNDLEVFRATGRGILVGEGNAELRKAAWKRVKALPEILDLL